MNSECFTKDIHVFTDLEHYVYSQTIAASVDSAIKKTHEDIPKTIPYGMFWVNQYLHQILARFMLETDDPFGRTLAKKR